jgi:hypothetical protein
MTKHLESCEQRAAIQAEAGSHQKAQKTRAFHLVVEGYRLPMYWMYLEVPAGTTLATLDVKFFEVVYYLANCFAPPRKACQRSECK